ncbi:uncharacterized protein At1g08160 [Aristolochia californica]|uniref:uncharacterized protein At1g08160 n=1 Tax=Aristolochia californica TaxID=171875 RepID=UPI0035D607C1
MPTPAPAPVPQRAATPSKRSRILRCVVIAILCMIVMHGLIVLLAWLIIKPRPVSYTVEDGSLHGFSLANDSLNATFGITLRVNNPNHRMALSYRSFDISVWFKDQMLAFDEIGAFQQRRRNSTRIEAKAEARSVQLMRYVADELNRQKKSGEIKLQIRVKARLRFKVGIVKTGVYHLKAFCSPVVLHFNANKWFERTYCNVDL